MSESSTRATSSRRLADRLAQARRRRFVGRQDEIALFRSAINAHEPPFSVLHVYGPGGVGKTTLLGEYARLAAESGLPTFWLDGRNMEASPPGFLISLASVMSLSEEESPLEALDHDWRGVIVIDTYERLAPLDGWMRETFMPQLPERSLVVFAGRDIPDPAWNTDPGWVELVRILPLRNLMPDESRAYLDARGITDDQQRAVLEFTYGHPLALSIVADFIAQGDGLTEIDPAEHPDMVGALVERFVRGAPSPEHRRAIEICAHARVTTEALLASVFGESAGYDLFNWLRGLSFIEQRSDGVFPHDLARDVIHADVRWRDPDAYRHIHDQVRRFIVDRLQRSQGMEQQRTFFDLLFLHRNNPFMKPYYDWRELGNAYAERAGMEDQTAILDVLCRLAGEESARIAEYWFKRSPGAFSVFRSRGSDFLGFAGILTLGETSPKDIEADPAIQPIREFIDHYGPLRSGEEFMLVRFAMASDGRRYSGALDNMLAMSFTTHVLTNPRLAWSFIITQDPDYWHRSYAYLNQFRSPEAEFDADGTHFAVFSHDWRIEPPVIWLETLARREIATDLTIENLEASRPTPVIVLSQPEFQEAVRRALRDYTRPDNLAKNPLMRSRLITRNGAEPSEPRQLQTLIRAAADTLRGNPKDERLYRAIRRTYLEPAATQELAAESLGLPFSTYRYHLSNGVDRITAWLWERELNPPES